jgi:DNA-binding MarR family transcriptional regulator
MKKPIRHSPKAVKKSSRRRSDYVLDEQIGFLLRVAMQRHTAIFMSRMIEGLTQTQFAALAKLLAVGPCSQNQLGRLIYLDAATTKGVVDRLESRRLVVIRPDPHDRRRREIALTRTGHKLAATATRVARQITRETLVPLTGSEAQAMLRLLKNLI